MATLVKQPSQETVSHRDIYLSASMTASGFIPMLQDRSGVVYFTFHGDATKLKAIEEAYWAGTLKLPVRQAFENLRTLKDRLYAAKGSR